MRNLEAITATNLTTVAFSEDARMTVNYRKHWSGRRDSNPRPSAPKAGHTHCWNLLKSAASKCFIMNGLRRPVSRLLFSVASGCFGCYKFDYSWPRRVFSSLVSSGLSLLIGDNAFLSPRRPCRKNRPIAYCTRTCRASLHTQDDQGVECPPLPMRSSVALRWMC